MNATSRRFLAGLALVLATALATTACIGVQPGSEPRPGTTTRFVLHPGFSNTGPVLTNPGDVNASYRASPNRGRPTAVTVRYRVGVLKKSPTGGPDTNETLPVARDMTRLVHPQTNGSFTVYVDFPAHLCVVERGRPGPATVEVFVHWSNGSFESVAFPIQPGKTNRVCNPAPVLPPDRA